MKNEFEREYDSLSDEYVSKRGFFSSPKSKIFELLKETSVIGKTVLDLGCGDGKHSQTIKELGAKNVIGIDISNNFIEKARQRNLGDCQFLVADANKIPLPDNSVDIVFSNYVIHYFIDTSKVFLEVARVLKSKGYFITTFNTADVAPGFENLYNQQMIIRLGNAENNIIIHNLIKSRKEIEKSVHNSGLILIKEMEVGNPFSVIDDSDPNKDYIAKRPILMLLKKA